jgi:hypothetical protein
MSSKAGIAAGNTTAAFSQDTNCIHLSNGSLKAGWQPPLLHAPPSTVKGPTLQVVADGASTAQLPVVVLLETFLCVITAALT